MIEHARALDRLRVVVERPRDPLDAEVRHALVDLARPARRTRSGCRTRAPARRGRTGRPAGSGRPCRGRARSDMNPYGLVAAASTTSQTSMLHPVAEDRQLVDERDVHRAEDVLEQLGELRRLRRRDLRRPRRRPARRARPPARGTRRRQPADDLRRVAQRVVGAARVDPLGEKATLKSRPAARPDSSSSGTSRSRVVPG